MISYREAGTKFMT